MKVKFGLRIKFLLIFLVFTLALSGATAYIVRNSYEDVIIDKYYEHASSIAKLTAAWMDGERIRTYAETGEQTEQYLADLETINTIKAQTGVYYLYVMYPLNDEEGIYIFDAALTEEQKKEIDSYESSLGEEVYFGDDFNSALEVMASAQISSHLDITTTLQGEVEQTLASAYAPVLGEDGKPVAFVGVDVNMTDVETYVREASFELILAITCVMVLCFLALLIMVQISVFKPVKNLTKAAENLSEGRYGATVPVRGRDEISEITRVFNRMSENIRGHVEDINRLNEAYHKYVPSRFFEWLKKEQVTEVKLADQRQQELMVQIFNVNGFDERIRKMNSKEMFVYINQVLQYTVPEVTAAEGMIETFHEGGFTALYRKNSVKALDAAVSICQSLNYAGREREDGQRTEFSIGLAYGSVMLGVVGHDARMSAISISHQTELAGFLQQLGAKYYAHILMTGSAAAQVEDFGQVYHSRMIGYLYNSYTRQLEKIYDVYDGDSEEDMRRKDMTKAVFEKGVSLYCARKFYEARSAFVEVLRQFRKDAAAREYLFRCNQYYQREDADEIDIYIEKF